MRPKKNRTFMTRTLPLFAASLAAALSSACIRAEPQTAYLVEPANPANNAYAVQEGDTLYIYLGGPPASARPRAPEPMVVAAPEEAPENPFETTRAWSGDYTCPQGLTDMRIHVVRVRGLHVDGVLEFHHVPSGAAGKYAIEGRYNPSTRTVTFTPGDWIERPPNYVSVPMRGAVSADGSRFDGRILHESCGEFHLRAR